MRIHYHIVWMDRSTDWERFDTREEADSVAKKLIRRIGETYRIEEFEDDTCVKCRLRTES